jgi:uncharacterized protein YidB (DUF937 family)
MGLLDILNGMQNGPRGQRQPSNKSESGGMSPLMMALIGLLAYKAMKGFGSAQAGGSGQPTPLPQGGKVGGQGGGLGDLLGGNQVGRPLPQGGNMSGPGGGLGDLLGGLLGGKPGGMSGGRGLEDVLRGGLGGLLAGGAAGSVLGGGLDNLLKGFQQSGQGRTAQSWVSKGPNEEISPGDLEASLGSDTLDALAQQTGMDRGDLLGGLSQQLPDFIDQLTPDGRLPSEEEWSRMV